MSQKNNEIIWSPYKFDFQGAEEEETKWSDDEDDSPTVMQTPFGIFRVDDSMNPFKRFDFWMANTNFDLNKEVLRKLKKIPGVEVLIILTRYRFIIAAGKCFEFRDVRVNIERELCGKHVVSALIKGIGNIDIANHVSNLHKEISKSPYWAIYVFPNGSIDYINEDERTNKFIRTQTLYEYAQQISNGILITSED